MVESPMTVFRNFLADNVALGDYGFYLPKISSSTKSTDSGLVPNLSGKHENFRFYVVYKGKGVLVVVVDKSGGFIYSSYLDTVPEITSTFQVRATFVEYSPIPISRCSVPKREVTRDMVTNGIRFGLVILDDTESDMMYSLNLDERTVIPRRIHLGITSKGSVSYSKGGLNDNLSVPLKITADTFADGVSLFIKQVATKRASDYRDVMRFRSQRFGN